MESNSFLMYAATSFSIVNLSSACGRGQATHGKRKSELRQVDCRCRRRWLGAARPTWIAVLVASCCMSSVMSEALTVAERSVLDIAIDPTASRAGCSLQAGDSDGRGLVR